MTPEASSTALLHALLILLLLGTIGYLSVRTGFLPSRVIEALSKFIIHISLPALIIVTLGTNLRYQLLDELGLCFLAALLLNLMGLVLAYLFRKAFLPRNEQGQRLFLSLSAIQNSGYLPIPLVTAILPGDLVPLGLLLTFVYIMVMGLIFWSLGIWLIAEGMAADWKENLKRIANPPIIAILSGLFFLWAPLREGFAAMPALQETLKLIGDTTIPLVMVVLGGSLAERIPKQKAGRQVTRISALLKLVVIPACTLLAVTVLPMERTFAFVLVLQAAMPAAMNHIVVVREYGGNIQLTARALFLHYALSLGTIPVFLYLFAQLY
jgi:predicted permease